MRLTIPVNVGDTVVDRSTGKRVKILGMQYITGRWTDNTKYYDGIAFNTELGIKYLNDLSKEDPDYEYLYDLHSV